MHVLVTGGAGFVGTHVTQTLLAAGHTVTIIDDLTTGRMQNVPSDAHFVKMSVCSPLGSVFGKVKPDAVVHLAAQVSVPNSVAHPQYDMTVNVIGTSNIMETAARHNVKKVVAISSAAVYGTPLALPLSESSQTCPQSPYGLSKLTAEHYIRMLAEQCGIPYTIIRPANIYGPNQLSAGEGAVVPAFLNSFFQGLDPVIHGDGTQTRDFIYVTDVAKAIERALVTGDGQTLNVSSAEATSVLKLWTMLAGLAGWRRHPKYASTRAGDIPHSVMANTLARQVLDWEPVVPLEYGLAQTVSWMSMRGTAVAEHD